jgi:hypothetical protein
MYYQFLPKKILTKLHGVTLHQICICFVYVSALVLSALIGPLDIVTEQRKFSRNWAGEDADFSKYFSLLYVTSVPDVHNSHVEEEKLQLNKT